MMTSFVVVATPPENGTSNFWRWVRKPATGLSRPAHFPQEQASATIARFRSTPCCRPVIQYEGESRRVRSLTKMQATARHIAWHRASAALGYPRPIPSMAPPPLWGAHAPSLDVHSGHPGRRSLPVRCAFALRASLASRARSRAWAPRRSSRESQRKPGAEATGPAARSRPLTSKDDCQPAAGRRPWASVEAGEPWLRLLPPKERPARCRRFP